MIAAVPHRLVRRAPRLFPSLALAPFLIATPPSRADCLSEYSDCVWKAAELDSAVKRSFAGLGCFADLISCLQRRLA